MSQPVYRPRDPKQHQLYGLLLEHKEGWQDHREQDRDPEHGFLRSEVIGSFESFLECGQLRFGFARLKCDA